MQSPQIKLEYLSEIGTINTLMDMVVDLGFAEIEHIELVVNLLLNCSAFREEDEARQDAIDAYLCLARSAIEYHLDFTSNSIGNIVRRNSIFDDSYWPVKFADMYPEDKETWRAEHQDEIKAYNEANA